MSYRYQSIRWAILLLFTLAGCGGGGGSGGGGGNGGGPSSPPPPPGNPTQFGTLTIAQANADIVGLAVGFAEGILAIAQTAANEVVIFSSPSGVASRDCNNGGTATITNVDADTSFSVTAGDSLTIDFDECFGDLVNGDMTGTVEVAITDYQTTETTVSLGATVTITNPLRIADSVDPALFSDVTAVMEFDFSAGPSESLDVRPSAGSTVSVTVADVTESISNFTINRTVSADAPDSLTNEIDIELTFNFLYDSELFGGTATCETNPVFSLVLGNVRFGNVLCRGRDSTGLRTIGVDAVEIDTDGDGTFDPLATIDWFVVFDEFLREMSGLDIEDLFSAIPTQTVSLHATDVFYDAGRDRLLVTTSQSDSSVPNALIGLSLSQNTQDTLQSFTAEPSAVALSADGSLLYVGFTNSGQIQKYDANTMQLLSTLQIDSDDIAGEQYGVLDLAVSPNDPATVAATFNYIGTGVDDVAVFVNDIQLAGRFRNAPGGSSSAGERLFFSEDGARIHSYYQPFPANTGAYDMVVDATGVTEAFTNRRFGSDLALAEGSLYSTTAEFDDETYVKLGTFGFNGGNIAVDPIRRRFYTESFETFEVWDLDRRLLIATYEIGFAFNTVERVVVAGDYVVFVTDADLRVLDTADIEALPAGECVVTDGQSIGGDAYRQYSCDVIDAVYDAVGDRVYAGVTSDVPVNGNSIAVINDNTGVIEDYIPVPSDPKRLALSADGSRLYVIFADAELLVAIDTLSRTVIQTWQMGVITAQAGYNELEPRKILQIAASRTELNAVVVLASEEVNTLEKEFIAFRDGERLADEVPVSALKSNTSFPYPRIVFDDTGMLYALHDDSGVPYFETLMLSGTGLSTTGVSFDAVNAVWFPYDVSAEGSDVFFAIGDVTNLVSQTVERRFDYNVLPFQEVNAPTAVYADENSDDVWFLSRASFESTGLARFDNASGTLIGTEELSILEWGRNSDFSHASIFGVGDSKLGLVIDEREGVLIIDKSVIQ